MDRRHSASFGGLLVLIDLGSPLFVPSLPQRRFFGLSVFPLSLELLALPLCLGTLLQPTFLLFFLKTATGWRRSWWLCNYLCPNWIKVGPQNRQNNERQSNRDGPLLQSRTF